MNPRVVRIVGLLFLALGLAASLAQAQTYPSCTNICVDQCGPVQCWAGGASYGGVQTVQCTAGCPAPTPTPPPTPEPTEEPTATPEPTEPPTPTPEPTEP